MGLSSLNWITVVWSAACGICLTLAVINFAVWLRRSQAVGYGIFALLAAATAVMAFLELAMMQSTDPADYAVLLRWAHVVVFILLVSIVCFVRVYLRAGRAWLGWSACLLRGVSLIVNFASPGNLNFFHIVSLRQVPFLGGYAAVPVGDRNPWMLLAQSALLLLTVFLLDAAVEIWRRGERRKALIAGVAFFGFVFLGLLQAVASFWGFANIPITPSVFFVGVVVVMGFELSRDILRAEELATELHQGERRLALAAEAANLGIWIRGPGHGVIWASPQWRKLFGFTESEPIALSAFLQRIHPDDRPLLEEVLWSPNRAENSYEVEYRIVRRDGKTAWIASRGRFEADNHGKIGPAFGVSIDITLRKEAEQKLQEQRAELTHLSRVATLGELSGSLAHELNQPLTAILSNAQAAQRFLARPDFDRQEIEEILRDIVVADLHAGEVIKSLRALFKKGEINRSVFDLNSLVRETLKLVRSDLLNRRTAIDLSLHENPLIVSGDRVQLQQVLLNLILNGVEAIGDNTEQQRQLSIGTSLTNGEVRIAIRDYGQGIAPDLRDKIFEPFFTTKAQGLGLGLAVCRSILSAHGATLELAAPADGGAEFFFVLPLHQNPA